MQPVLPSAYHPVAWEHEKALSALIEIQSPFPPAHLVLGDRLAQYVEYVLRNAWLIANCRSLVVAILDPPSRAYLFVRVSSREAKVTGIAGYFLPGDDLWRVAELLLAQGQSPRYYGRVQQPGVWQPSSRGS